MATITRCPKCHTSFRITEAHLKSAKGAVRCGSCLNIFNARAHLVSEGSEESKTAGTSATPSQQKPLTNKPKPVKSPPTPVKSETPPAEPPPPKKPAVAEKDDEDDILISDDMPLEDMETEGSEADFNDNIFYSKTFGGQDSNLFERVVIDDDDDDDEKSDESWALNLINDSEEEDLPKLMKDTGVGKAVTEEDLVRADAEEFEESFDDGYEEMDSEQLEEELQQIRRSGIHEPVFTSAEPTMEELEAVADDDYGQRPVNENSNHQFIHAIEPEPVEFSYKTASTFWESRWLWGSLSALMAMLIIAQVSWLQFNRLNKTEPFRSYYQTVCPLVGCQVPPLEDRTAIRAVNLVVRSHPQQPNALVVDAVLQNAAEFPQRFPILDLVFTDLRDKPVAARRFEPKDYLAGEMAGKQMMPSKQPVHIALEIADPGEQAVGYRIEIAQ